MESKIQTYNKQKKVNAWFVERYKFLADHNKENFRNEVIKKCNELEIHITTHILNNWIYHVTKLKGFMANLIKPILEKWEKIDEQERFQAKNISQTNN